MDVSFIVPLYKGKKFIDKIINLVEKNQIVLKKYKQKRKIEIIFVNDYPMEIIKEEDLQSTSVVDDIVLVTNTTNLGIHRARIKGLNKARGEYVIFLDQDDEIVNNYLLNQFYYIGDNDAVLCNGTYRGNKFIYRNEEQQRKAISKDTYLLQDTVVISPGQVMIRREAIPKEWKKFHLYANGSDDVFLWILMLRDNVRFSINPLVEYHHMEDEKNTSFNFSSMKESIEELIEVVDKNSLLEEKDFSRFKNAIQKRILKYNEYIKLLDNWDEIVKKLDDLLVNNKLKNVAVYGYGIIGKKLLKKLDRINVTVECVIDADALSFETKEYKLCTPEDIQENIDGIIITPLFAESEIRETLKRWDSNIISLKELYP